VHKPPLLAFAALVAGTSLIVAATTGSVTTRLRQGGTLRVNLPVTDIDDIDPSLAYGETTWQIEYSTGLKLLNYPDAPGPRGSQLVPEGASSFTVSRDGTTYMFTIRRGFRFSDGSKVTAENYAFAINRALSRDLQSPGFEFVADSFSANGVNIVGAQAVRDGTAPTAAGVRVHGRKLTIRLTKPNGTFLSRITMPFFQAMPKTLPSTNKVVSVDAAHPLPSAGPYYVAERIPNRLVVLKKNPHYAAGVAKSYKRRPANLDQVNIRTGVNKDASYQEVKSDQADYTYSLPNGVAEEIEEKFGLKGRFRVRPRNCISYIALNSNSRLFHGNPRLRRAVNYVLNRKAMVELSGEYAAVPADQYLPAGSPGFKNIDAYPFTPDVAKARELAEGHVPSGGPWIYYYSLYSPGPQRMELVRRQLQLIGIEIAPQGWRGYGFDDRAGKRNSPHAFATGGWCEYYPDPYGIINVLLYGGSIQDENNNNIAYFNSRLYDRRMDRAAKLVGPARLRAYERIEHDLVTKAAPWAVWGQPAKKFFFSDSVDMRSFAYQPIYEVPPYNLLALK
jgi:ABC-type transport system substrate-binding protein